MPQPLAHLSPRPSTLRILQILFIGLAASLTAVPATADLEVVFLLDTTGSMGGELREVKERVGQLAASLAQAREGEVLRFGAVAYRDRGDDYVTLVSPLTTNLEASQSFLAALRAQGGGDGPESVVAGLEAALSEIDWDFGPGVQRQVFLIGDAPPHLDYPDEPKPRQLIERARSLGIVIHAIGCRSLPPRGIAFFRRLAFRTEGSYQHIGRVRSGQTGVAEALLRAAVPPASTTTFDRGRELTLTWLDRRQSTVTPDQPGAGLLVRPGGALAEGAASLGQSAEGLAAKSPCMLEFLTPAGFDLAEAPRAWLGSEGLSVKVRLTADSSIDAGGIDLFRLDTCPALETPIRLITERN